MILPQEIIRIKRDKKELSSAEISRFFEGYLAGNVADYQVSSMLMAILLNGMSLRETADLTRLMRDSGEVFDWKISSPVVVDKHSTGGIGDKTSLVLLPLAVLEGVKVPMISGRGLGHTGGTLDKLEAIPGMNVFPSPVDAHRILNKHSGVFMGQTDRIAPLDKKLYAMRDVTATVESIPLITASILSKKLSEGLDGLVMDIKFGSGAFMQEWEKAKLLASSLIAVGKECGLKISGLLTDMGSPLGDKAGNALEVYECIEIMQGQGASDTRELSLELAKEMVLLAYPHRDPIEVRKALESHLTSGKAFEVFKTIIKEQGGDIDFLDHKEKLVSAKIRKPVHATTKGEFVASIDVRQIGVAIQTLGGGRRLMSDKVDPSVGFIGLKHVGDQLSPGEPLAFIHGNDAASVEKAISILQSAYQLTSKSVSKPVLIRERLT